MSLFIPYEFEFFAEADSGLVKLVVMTNVFFNKQQHEVEIKLFISLNRSSLDYSATAEINVFIMHAKRRFFFTEN